MLFAVKARYMTALSAGFTLPKTGGVGILGGRSGSVCDMALWTSAAAASILRVSSNCRLMLTLPELLCELIEVKPAIALNRCSRGVATDAAMVSAFAPGKLAATAIVGKSIFGN